MPKNNRELRDVRCIKLKELIIQEAEPQTKIYQEPKIGANYCGAMVWIWAIGPQDMPPSYFLLTFLLAFPCNHYRNYYSCQNKKGNKGNHRNPHHQGCPLQTRFLIDPYRRVKQPMGM
jgi:hypothetical protein